MKARWLVVALIGITSAAYGQPKDKRAAAPAAATRCSEPSECGLYAANCCGDCGVITADSAVAYNADWVGENAQPGCTGIACPKCTQGDDDQLQHQLVATCEKRHCVVKNLDQMPITQCKSDGQCIVALPRCCSCDWSNAVAVRTDQKAALARLACTKSDHGVGCPACAQTGAKPRAVCKKGRCALKIVPTNGTGPELEQ